MSRKPADILAASLVPEPRLAIWTAIRNRAAKNQNFTISEIWEDCRKGINRSAVRDYFKCLIATKFLKVATASQGKGKPAFYKLIKNDGSEAPRVNKRGEVVTSGLGTEALWRTMRIKKLFTPEELVLEASTEEAPIALTAVLVYLRHLKKVGFVSAISEASTRRNSAQRTHYRFVQSRDPGPKAPQIQRVKRVFDPNSNTVVPPIEVVK